MEVDGQFLMGVEWRLALEIAQLMNHAVLYQGLGPGQLDSFRRPGLPSMMHSSGALEPALGQVVDETLPGLKGSKDAPHPHLQAARS